MYHYAGFNCVASKNKGMAYRQDIMLRHGLPVPKCMVECDERWDAKRKREGAERVTRVGRKKRKCRKANKDRSKRDAPETEGEVDHEGGVDLMLMP
ncbi:hypothetical protein CYMTET_7633 [Cymbomonas tetramitiformis]|uniref:Uncharacterized protein n=1 Tax=Cymbomonas tetramitiformis TaxID=36881 RepID=A0AAE0LGP7_9CHLO|nr:hypothetical protein CYMTET_7633 [Cymbomonas tetramitiformis]